MPMPCAQDRAPVSKTKQTATGDWKGVTQLCHETASTVTINGKKYVVVSQPGGTRLFVEKDTNRAYEHVPK
eukprot:3553051-Rhodomonas_salina.1